MPCRDVRPPPNRPRGSSPARAPRSCSNARSGAGGTEPRAAYDCMQKPSQEPAALAPPAAVRDLRKVYGSVVAVDGITFSLLPGTVTALLGGNGAGKTT